MKLEVGMYVRTKDGIGKIDETRVFIDTFEIHLDSNKGRIHNVTDNTYWNTSDDIIGKPSKNPIDLIEVGDYVNGYYVSKIWKIGEITHYVDEKPIQRKEIQITIQAPSYGGIIHLHNEDIKSIVTHEQFSAMEYGLGDK